MDHLGPYAFNVCRFLVGALSLLPLLFFLRKKESGSTELNPSFWKFSIFAGFALFGGATLQQVGIQYTTVGKAGFITGLYVVIVPILGLYLTPENREVDRHWMCLGRTGSLFPEHQAELFHGVGGDSSFDWSVLLGGSCASHWSCQ